jgi:hypothetical protein
LEQPEPRSRLSTVGTQAGAEELVGVPITSKAKTGPILSHTLGTPAKSADQTGIEILLKIPQTLKLKGGKGAGGPYATESRVGTSVWSEPTFGLRYPFLFFKKKTWLINKDV